MCSFSGELCTLKGPNLGFFGDQKTSSPHIPNQKHHFCDSPNRPDTFASILHQEFFVFFWVILNDLETKPVLFLRTGRRADPVFFQRLQQQLLESSHKQRIEAIRSARGNHSTAQKNCQVGFDKQNQNAPLSALTMLLINVARFTIKRHPASIDMKILFFKNLSKIKSNPLCLFAKNWSRIAFVSWTFSELFISFISESCFWMFLMFRSSAAEPREFDYRQLRGLDSDDCGADGYIKVVILIWYHSQLNHRYISFFYDVNDGYINVGVSNTKKIWCFLIYHPQFLLT